MARRLAGQVISRDRRSLKRLPSGGSVWIFCFVTLLYAITRLLRDE